MNKMFKISDANARLKMEKFLVIALTKHRKYQAPWDFLACLHFSLRKK